MEEETKVEIFDLSTEQQKATEYLDKFKKAKTFNSPRFDAYAELMAFYQGNQHLLKKYATTKPWVIDMNTPYASVSIDKRVASLLANDYIGALLPMSADDVPIIEPLEKIFTKEWKRLNMDYKIRECIAKSAVVREAYLHLRLDKNSVIGGINKKSLGALDVYAIEPGAILIDPTARSLKAARFMFVLDRISKEEAEGKFPKIKQLTGSADTMTPDDRGEHYLDNDYVTSQEDVLSDIFYYGKVEINGKTKIKRVRLISGIIVDEKIMDLKSFPIYQLRWKKAAQSCYGLGLMDDVLSLQKAICSIESAITNTALAYVAPGMMVRKGCGVDPAYVAKTNGAPGVVYAVEGDLTNAMKPITPPKIEESILNIKEKFKDDIKEITGDTPEFSGTLGTAGNTSNGANKVIARATIIETKVLNNIAEFVEDISEGLIDYIINIYGGETINVPEGKDKEGKYMFTDVELPEQGILEQAQYKYYIELNTKTPFSKEKQKDVLLELFRLERQYDTPIKTVTVSDILKSCDLENKDILLDRYTNLTYQDAQSKAEVINNLVIACNQRGIPNELLLQGVSEIIGNAKDTPNVDEIMKMLEGQFQQQMQKQEMQQSEAIKNVVDQLPNELPGVQAPNIGM